MEKGGTDYQSELKISEEFDKKINEIKLQILAMPGNNTKEKNDAFKNLGKEPFVSHRSNVLSDLKKIIEQIRADNETDSEQNSNK